MPPPLPQKKPPITSLSLILLSTTVKFALLVTMPPPTQEPTLPLIALPVTVSVAPGMLKMPPPDPVGVGVGVGGGVGIAGPGAGWFHAAKVVEWLTMLWLSVSPPSLRMPPPLPPAAPLVMVKPEMVTFDAK